MADENTLRFYADNAEAYASRERQTSPRLLAFLSALAPGARILELGTGGGHDAAEMLARGFDVDPTDASPELATEAGRRLGRSVAIMRFDQLDAANTYDGVWANAALLHALKPELTSNIALIHRALKPGAVVMASFKAGHGEGRDSLGRYYNYPDAGTLKAHFCDAAPWSSLVIETEDGSGYDGVPTVWLWVRALKSGD